jgi:hypothetical protein
MPNQVLYPLRPNERELTRVAEIRASLEKRLTSEPWENAWQEIRNEIGESTGAICRNPPRDWIRMGLKSLFPFAEFSKDGRVVGIDPDRQNILENALFVSMRFKWAIEEVMALWIMEGLPDTADALPYEIRTQSDQGWKLVMGRPQSEEYARAVARSNVLYWRWGLDILTPTRFVGKDNELLDGAPLVKHNEAFNKGFDAEIRQSLSQSPIDYLSRQDGAIEIQLRRGQYYYKTKLEYQSTVLALQSARYQGFKQRPPNSCAGCITEDNTPSTESLCSIDNVRLSPPFPALLYIYFNARKPQETISSIVHAMKQKLRRTHYDVSDVRAFYFSNKIPPNIEKKVQLDADSGLSPITSAYVNGLRFECVHRFYSSFFLLDAPFVLE